MAMDAFDLAERLQTLVFVMSDLDLGMNTWMSRPFDIRTSRSIAASCSTTRRSSASASGAATRTSTATAFPIAPFPATDAGVFHPRLRPQREAAVQRAARRLREQHGSAGAQVRDRAQPVPKPVVEDATGARSASSATAAATFAIDESRDQLARETGIKTGVPALRAYPFTDELDRVHRPLPARLRRRAEPRRADADADADRDLAERIAKLRSVLHYSGLPIDARSITDDILAQEGVKPRSPHHEWRGRGRGRAGGERGSRGARPPERDRHGSSAGSSGETYMSHRHQPRSKEEEEPHRPRDAALSRRQDHALRRVRPQRHLRAHHRCVLRDGRRPEAGHQALGHRLLEQEPGVLPGRRTASTRCTAGCRRSAPARCWPTGS